MPTDFNRLNGPQRKILRETLKGVFVRARNLDVFLADNNHDDLESIAGAGAFPHQIFELIREFGATGKLNPFMAAVLRNYAESPAIVDLPARLSLTANDKGLEKMVRDAGFSDVNLWADRLVRTGRSMCRIAIPIPGGSGQQVGTGFLVAPDLVLTNYHVVEPVLKGGGSLGGVRLNFGYAETSEGLSPGEQFGLAAVVAWSPYSSADLAPNAGVPTGSELDFALLRLDHAAAGRAWLSLSGGTPPPTPGAIVHVLQHPRGRPLKLSSGIVQQPVTPLRMRYDADTEGGSSGAIVVDQNLDPVALHHAGDPDSAKIRAEFNQGVPLSLILASLEGNPTVEPFWLNAPPAPESGK